MFLPHFILLKGMKYRARLDTDLATGFFTDERAPPKRRVVDALDDPFARALIALLVHNKNAQVGPD
jgi:hypothetical protein